MRFLHRYPHTNMQFLQKHERIPESPPGPSPTWVWGGLGISLVRRMSRQQEKKRPERTENRVLKGIIHKCSVSLLRPRQKPAAIGELTSHLSSRTGNGRSSIKCQRCPTRVGSTGNEEGGSEWSNWFFSIRCCNTGRTHADQLSLHQWDERLKGEKKF